MQSLVWFTNRSMVSSHNSRHLFLPLTCIKSRVAYCKTSVNFGRVVGTDSVIIAVPLSSCSFNVEVF